MQQCGGRLASCSYVALQRRSLPHRLALNISGKSHLQKYVPRPAFRPLVTASRPCHQSRRSPFVVLGLPPTATIDQIKSSFRTLALQYHPDLRSSSAPEDDKADHEFNHQRMAEILDAYERLMDRDYSMLLTPGNSQLAAACEVLTLEDLREDSRFDIRAIWMRYNDDTDGDTERNSDIDGGSALHSAVSISIHPDSSISDLKQDLLHAYKNTWNLQNRRIDRYGLVIGWELVLPQVQTDGSTYLQTLGNHDFVKHHYGILSNTLLYAVIQNYGSDID